MKGANLTRVVRGFGVLVALVLLADLLRGPFHGGVTAVRLAVCLPLLVPWSLLRWKWAQVLLNVLIWADLLFSFNLVIGYFTFASVLGSEGMFSMVGMGGAAVFCACALSLVLMRRTFSAATRAAVPPPLATPRRLMLKNVAIFAAGGVAAVIALPGISRLFAHRSVSGTTFAPAPVTAVVTIHVTQNPEDLLPVQDASQLLDRISGLPAEQRRKIRAALDSGLITSIHLESRIGDETHWIDVRPDKPNLATQGSMKFGPMKLTIKKHDNPVRPTTRETAP